MSRLVRMIRSWTRGQFIVLLVGFSLYLAWSAWERHELQAIIDLPIQGEDCSAFAAANDSAGVLRCTGRAIAVEAAEFNGDMARRDKIGELGWGMVLITGIGLITSWLRLGHRPPDKAQE